MYVRSSKLINLPVISLQSGDAVAWIRRPVIEMTTFNILALECDSPNHPQAAILTTNDIRQLAPDCVIIDSEDELTEPDDIIRLQPFIKASYAPIDSSVVTDSGHKLGRVEDYSINLDTSQIQRLYVHPPLFHLWLGTNHTIDRSQIIDITPGRITVRDATIEQTSLRPDPIPEINS
jgi:sporulation protein YlmC with PRC-barrel domain